MNKPRNFYKNTCHHLYNRGTNKGKIFFEDEEYLYFLKKAGYYKVKYKIDILAYCLMPNHFHFFVKQKTDTFSISQFISALLNSYTKSINIKYKRSGTLFESKTKSKEIKDESYFMWVIKYILENPVKANLVATIESWDYSNAKDLLNLREGKLTNVGLVTSYFQSKKQMIKFLRDPDIKTSYEF
ncbi:MAG: hypothetical protein CO128_10345 [Ignavibacteriales bacterium CG_4_9_14_3_um_filter_30_11]|nr:MAG: hypothetical protein CO128_10345 [Ignavibacteriales bacterium CG_4_9_14_3_um_filter_30_11]